MSTLRAREADLGEILARVGVRDAVLRAGVDAGMATAAKLRSIGHGFTPEYFAMAVSQDAAKAVLSALQSVEVSNV
jgi:hypothetical protein